MEKEHIRKGETIEKMECHTFHNGARQLCRDH
nr:MAG TPA: hypothetical protein [Caudoviricetes sp.]